MRWNVTGWGLYFIWGILCSGYIRQPQPFQLAPLSVNQVEIGGIRLHLKFKTDILQVVVKVENIINRNFRKQNFLVFQENMLWKLARQRQAHLRFQNLDIWGVNYPWINIHTSHGHESDSKASGFQIPYPTRKQMDYHWGACIKMQQLDMLMEGDAFKELQKHSGFIPKCSKCL